MDEDDNNQGNPQPQEIVAQDNHDQENNNQGNPELHYMQELNLLAAAQELLEEVFQERYDEAVYLLNFLALPAGFISTDWLNYQWED